MMIYLLLNEAYFNIEKLLNKTIKIYQQILPYKTLVETQKEIINKKTTPAGVAYMFLTMFGIIRPG